MDKDVTWFRKEIEPILVGYSVKYKVFEQGDFGSLNQVEFNSSKIGGNIDFWGLGWLGVFVWDYERKEEIINILLEPSQKDEKEEILARLNAIFTT